MVAIPAEACGCAFRAPPSRHHGTTTLDKAEGLPGSQERGLALRIIALDLPLVQTPAQQLGSAGDLGSFLPAHEVAAEGLPHYRALESTRAGSARCRGHRGCQRGPAVLCPPSHMPTVPAAGDCAVTCSCAASAATAGTAPIGRGQCNTRRSRPQRHLFHDGALPLEKHSSTWEILQRLQSCKSYFLGPHVKALASSLGKNVYDTTRWCKPLKLRMATNACPKQRRERARYVQGTQEVTARGHTWATAPDATRFSGRDWHCSTIVSVDPQLWAWMVPVALL